ncbi:MAG: carbon storage regulator CsrA [Spirochaetaceae bacterium]|jgi:carbon storage regulator|nr:carbon storage regulator CsrA [Spirochaetaceae bacterium]
MLILSRKTNEKIMIGDDIAITVIDIRGDQVRIGVDAPKQVKVYRQEVFDLVKAENQAAAATELARLPELGIRAVREELL